MSVLVIISIILFFYFLGFLILDVFSLLKKENIFARIGISYGLGMSAVILQMICYSLLRIQWNPFTLLFPWAIITCAYLVTKRKDISLQFSIKKQNKVDCILLIAIALLVCFTIFEAILRPVPAWDGWASWFIGGKAFYLAKNIIPDFYIYAQTSNPPFIHLLVAFIYTILGHPDDRLALLPFTFFYVSLLATFYGFLRNYFSKTHTLVFTFLLASIPDFIRHAGRYDVGNADLPLSYFFFISVILFVWFLEKKSWKYILLFNIFLGIATLVKTEGLPFFIIMQGIMLMTLLRKHLYKYIFLSLVGLCIAGIWHGFVFHFHLPTNPFFTGNIDIARVPENLIAFMKEFANIGRWNFLWIMYFLCLQFYKKNIYATLFFLISLLQLLVYFMIYLMTPVDPVAHIGNSFDRLLIQIAPLTFCAIVFAAVPLLSQVKSLKKFLL